MEKENKKNTAWVKYLVIIIIIVAIIIAIWLLFRGKETHTSVNPEETKTIGLVCSAGEIEGSFFTGTNPASLTQEIRGTFRNESLEKIQYIFDGEYESEKAAENAEAVLHARYNINMRDNGLSETSLYPVFNYSGNKTKITLTSERNKLNNVTIKFFYLDMDDYQKTKSNSIEDYKKHYENKGFSCTIYD